MEFAGAPIASAGPVPSTFQDRDVVKFEPLPKLSAPRADAASTRVNVRGPLRPATSASVPIRPTS